MADPILSVDDLSVEFETYEGRHRVLNGVDLTVEEGETVALIGETGCGKSVTAKSIMGTLPRPPAASWFAPGRADTGTPITAIVRGGSL
jgi:ABC-type dipeptide/oligopeptide/nickel transport system ATPase component